MPPAGSQPVVSVILPAFNAEQYVGDAIASILNQRFVNFELLVIDDGSTDSTAQVVRSFSDPRLRVLVNSRNIGLTRSLNRALVCATGMVIARQDADDLSEPDRLDEQVAYLNSHPDVVLVGSFFNVIDATGSVVGRTVLPSADLDLRWTMFFSCPFVHTAVMWRHAIVRDTVGRYNDHLWYSQDFDLWLRIAARYHIANVDKFLVRYRQHPCSMTASGDDRTLEGHRMRVAAVSDALAWSGTAEDRDTAFRNMTQLLHSTRVSDSPVDDILNAVRNVLALHAVMCQSLDLHPRIARSHARGVRECISSSLTRLSADRYVQGREAEARKLLFEAFAVRWPTALYSSARWLAPRMTMLLRRLHR